MSPDSNFVATTMFGLEEVLTSELLKLGARNIQKHNRAVSFTGDKGFMYKSNLCLRTALRILVPVKKIKVRDETELYTEIKKIEWEQFIDPENSFAVDTASNSPFFTHTLFVSQKAKDAIADRFRERSGKRPSVNLDDPDLRINLHIADEICSVSLDSSGIALYKRGYREETNLAPLNEVLAAGMILLTGWDKRSHFVDPMCGSGTLAIEAALYAASIPPGYFREKFGFMKWRDYEEDLWKKIYDSAVNKISNSRPEIIASDISVNVIKKARQNIKSAKVEDMILTKHLSFDKLEKPESGRGVMVINPPYGERMNKDELLPFYKLIGDTLKKNWKGYECWIISSNKEAIHQIGLHATRNIKLFNGSLECRYLKYSMYEGSKKDKSKNFC